MRLMVGEVWFFGGRKDMFSTNHPHTGPVCLGLVYLDPPTAKLLPNSGSMASLNPGSERVLHVKQMGVLCIVPSRCFYPGTVDHRSS